MSGNRPLGARSSVVATAAASSSVARASPPLWGRQEHVSLADTPTPQALGGAAEDERIQSGLGATKKKKIPIKSKGRDGFFCTTTEFLRL